MVDTLSPAAPVITVDARLVEGFARGLVGCTVTFEFTETGTFWVFAERRVGGGPIESSTGCAATPTSPNAPIDFDLAIVEGPPSAFAVVPDDTVRYRVDDRLGTALARIEVAAPVVLDIAISGGDVREVLAIGRDPYGS